MMTDELLKKILAEYAIPIFVSFEKIDKGFASENYKIITTDGIFFLKKHRGSGAKRIDSIEQAEQCFANGGIPVVLPIKNKNAKLYSVINGSIYVLYPFVSGKQYISGNIPLEMASKMGSVLAQAHLVTVDGFTGTYNEDPNFSLRPKDDALSRMDKIISSIPKKTGFDEIAIRELKLKKALLQNAGATIESIDRASRNICLGDYYPDNVFFDQDGNIAHIFDLDMAGPGPRIVELVRSALLTCCWYVYTPENIQKTKAFIYEYYKMYPFTEQELRDAIEFYFLKATRSIWREKLRYSENDFRSDADYKLALGEIEYLDKNRQSLLGVINPINSSMSDIVSL